MEVICYKKHPYFLLKLRIKIGIDVHQESKYVSFFEKRYKVFILLSRN